MKAAAFKTFAGGLPAPRLKAAQDMHAFLAGTGPDELVVPVNQDTKPVLEMVLRQASRQTQKLR
jgi:hypothetical protein